MEITVFPLPDTHFSFYFVLSSSDGTGFCEIN